MYIVRESDHFRRECENLRAVGFELEGPLTAVHWALSNNPYAYPPIETSKGAVRRLTTRGHKRRDGIEMPPFYFWFIIIEDDLIVYLKHIEFLTF